MYTRNQGTVRPTPVMHGTLSPTAERMTDVSQGSGELPYLIPQDYRGEFLRGQRMTVSDAAESVSVQTVEPEPVETEIPLEEQRSSDNTGIGNTGTGQENSDRGTSLIGGLYDFLLGENSSEEETLLLLGIALLLLWGHLDRGGLFDRASWDADDLALLLIGYLLLS